MDFDDIFRKCPKWEKEQVIRFWEWSGWLSGPSGSVLPDNCIHWRHPADTFSVRSWARFREFVHTLGRVVAKPTHQRVCAVATRRNTQNWRKKFVYYRKRRPTYFLIEMGEKSLKSSLFYFIYSANSNSRENMGILARFSWFLLIFKLVFCL